MATELCMELQDESKNQELSQKRKENFITKVVSGGRALFNSTIKTTITSPILTNYISMSLPCSPLPLKQTNVISSPKTPIRHKPYPHRTGSTQLNTTYLNRHINPIEQPLFASPQRLKLPHFSVCNRQQKNNYNEIMSFLGEFNEKFKRYCKYFSIFT